MPRVLLVEDELEVARPLIRLLEAAGASAVTWVPLPERALGRAALGRFDIIVADFALGAGVADGVQLIDDLRRMHPAATLVVISGLPRSVPDGVEFVPKTDPGRLEAIVSGWSRSG